MKTILIITITLFTVLMSFTKSFSHENKMRNYISDNDSTLLIQLENNWAIALVNKDETIFRKYLADNFIYTENEKLYTRDEVLQSLLLSQDTIENAYNQDMEIHIFGNTAVVTGFLIVIGKGTGGNFIHKYRYTDTWLNENGEWKLIAAQDYLIP